jgi:hypothetical protein
MGKSNSNEAGERDLSQTPLPPPLYIRLIRVIVPILAGLTAIAAFAWVSLESYDRANEKTLNDYIAQLELDSIPAEPIIILPPEERLTALFGDISSLSEDTLTDLYSFEYVISQQLASSQDLVIEREDYLVYFRTAGREYTISLISADSYPYIDGYLADSS